MKQTLKPYEIREQFLKIFEDSTSVVKLDINDRSVVLKYAIEQKLKAIKLALEIANLPDNKIEGLDEKQLYEYWLEKVYDHYISIRVIDTIEKYNEAEELRINPDQQVNLVQVNNKQKTNTEFKKEQSGESTEQHDYLISTIDEYLDNFKDLMNEVDYNTLVYALCKYLETGQFPSIQKIKVKKVNIKAFGWALNQIFECEKSNSCNDISYLSFAKQNISLFSNVEFNENNYQNCNLYKYFHTPTKRKPK